MFILNYNTPRSLVTSFRLVEERGAVFGYNSGISLQLKEELRNRGADFSIEDSPQGDTSDLKQINFCYL